MSSNHSAETVSLEGPDAIAFAQAQFGSKVGELAVGRWQFSAWLDAQGRVRALFHLARIGDEQLLLVLRGGDAATFAHALQRYVFRSRVVILAAEPRAMRRTDPLAMHAVRVDAAHVTLGCGSYGLGIASAQGDDDWRIAQVRAGWPWLPATQLEALLPPALSLQRLQAVAVDKGCYPGQEIVARLHYRGGHKRHLHSVMLSQPANIGAPLLRDGREAGCLLDVVHSSSGIEALAVIGDDTAAKIADGSFGGFDDGLRIELLASWPE